MEQTTTKQMATGTLEINHDLTNIRVIVEACRDALIAPNAPKSRERSLVVTKLEEAFFFAGEGLRKE